MLFPTRTRFLWLLFLLASLLLAACSHGEAQNERLAMAPMSGMPEEVRAAPVTVQQAYQFAVANSDVIGQLPCYCGCGPIGHTSNYACYVSGQEADGTLRFDNHALGCSICVDITQDAMRLSAAGQPLAEIRAYIDATYAQYGPSNIP